MSKLRYWLAFCFVDCSLSSGTFLYRKGMGRRSWMVWTLSRKFFDAYCCTSRCANVSFHFCATSNASLFLLCSIAFRPHGMWVRSSFKCICPHNFLLALVCISVVSYAWVGTWELDCYKYSCVGIERNFVYYVCAACRVQCFWTLAKELQHAMMPWELLFFTAVTLII